MTVIRPSILNINKPIGYTSRDVLNKLQRIYKYTKFGHAGTLDPLASGVLIVLVGNSTKKQDYFTNLNKKYSTRIFFGLQSPTYDLEGPLFLNKSIRNFNIKKENIVKYLESQKGEIDQTVPFFSAVKVKGKELYKHARTGNKITKLPTKKVKLLEYSVNDFNGDLNVENMLDYISKCPINNTIAEYQKSLAFFEANLPYVDLQLTTGSGFYVRSLARDMAINFNTTAVVGSLVRIAVGDYVIDDSLNLEYFENRPDLI
ncbi:tRNA pseudouridine(55) synthase TruB [candidate division WWE3 bacterium CG10_big_fil_rev_8_21_14_0_10_32_10]|uniref:tRNA pseudouridine(55) synthase n=1 Tax=candidate division WWE3 bacterium CG10_big_fil_rev_8_21_14_0_10_32_10 TaxID=1975090 RepID=A0A2H0RBH8_UNCKA|nr:MAG: tRNA pseudouridine(55) synthase TruB [candidate division WWE3 bacterium CG10_big_fil_rev_8_21_14_0_10_32_10]